MAIAWSRAPRHILYISVSLAIGAAAAMPIVACSMRDGPDGEPAPPAHAKPDDSTRIPAPPLPPAPAASGQPRAQETSPATSSESEPPGSDVDPFGLHEDDPDAESEVPRRLARGRKGRPIEIVLRSSPPGAVAAVDGVTIGPTPSLWQGMADASAREFTFALPGYAIARYRFVPTRSGIVHATLEPIKLPETKMPQPAKPPTARP